MAASCSDPCHCLPRHTCLTTPRAHTCTCTHTPQERQGRAPLVCHLQHRAGEARPRFHHHLPLRAGSAGQHMPMRVHVCPCMTVCCPGGHGERTMLRHTHTQTRHLHTHTHTQTRTRAAPHATSTHSHTHTHHMHRRRSRSCRPSWRLASGRGSRRCVRGVSRSWTATPCSTAPGRASWTAANSSPACCTTGGRAMAGPLHGTAWRHTMPHATCHMPHATWHMALPPPPPPHGA
jgi:hypothetical protein